MPFCHAPWTNLDIDPQGILAPCCKFQHSGQLSRIQEISISEYRAGAEIDQIKQDFERGQWPAGCARCRIEEENGIASKRMMDGERWADQYRTYDLATRTDLLTASIAFGNTCNLACVTCNPWVSSRWQREYAVLESRNVLPNHFYKQDFIDDFVSGAPNLIHLDVPGGEPFLSGTKEQLALLEHYIKSGQAQDLSLHYTTNATQWPDELWWHAWAHFDHVEIQLSIDAVGDRAGYIRWPLIWTDVTNNVTNYLDRSRCLSNISLSVSCTVSAYNIFYLDEVIEWCYTTGLPLPWMGRVHNPVHMRPTVWPKSARASIIQKLRTSRHATLETWADLLENLDDSDQFDHFCQHVSRQDHYRDTDFRKIFPEMASFI